MGLHHQLLTWIARLLISWQVLLSYLAFGDISILESNEATKVTSEEHDVYLYAWCFLSLIYGIFTFVGVKAFCEPDLYRESNVYYEILDLASRFACCMCWLYYFIVCFTWILYQQVDISKFGVLLGLLLLIILSCVGEINTAVLTIILAFAHVYVCFLVENSWGVLVGLSMIINGCFIIGCREPAPLCYWPTLVSMIATLTSSVFIIYFFKSLHLKSDELLAPASTAEFTVKSLSLHFGVDLFKKILAPVLGGGGSSAGDEDT